MIMFVIKKDGTRQAFNVQKIANSVYAAAKSGGNIDFSEAMKLANDIVKELETVVKTDTVNAEQLNAFIVSFLTDRGKNAAAKEFALYTSERAKIRFKNSPLMRTFGELTTSFNKGEVDVPGMMRRYAFESAKTFSEFFLLDPEFTRAHASGDFYIHNIEHCNLSTNACFIETDRLFKHGFVFGNTFESPKDIRGYTTLAAITMLLIQDDQHGEQAIADFDDAVAEGVKKTFIKLYGTNLQHTVNLLYKVCDIKSLGIEGTPSVDKTNPYYANELSTLAKKMGKKKAVEIQEFVFKTSLVEIDAYTYSAMEAFIATLSALASKFEGKRLSSVCYGLNTSAEGRIVIKNILAAAENSTYPLPVHVFKVKDGVNYNQYNQNYDLLRIAARAASKHSNIRFAFMDAPFNKSGSDMPGYMGGGIRVFENRQSEFRSPLGRGVIAAVTVNLVRTALRAHKNVDRFLQYLDNLTELAVSQLTQRFKMLACKKAKNYPFLFGQKVWAGSDALSPDDKTESALKNGTLCVGFTGLAEALKALVGFHHGEAKSSQEMGLKIIAHMREKLDLKSKETGLNFVLLATPAEYLTDRMEKLDKKMFGSISQITDRERYTNSFRVPDDCPLSPAARIAIEAPYHALTNGGHLTQVSVGKDSPMLSGECEKLIRTMYESGIGYASINTL